MSNPYISPTIANYNANPPANDGSKTVANQLDWDTHIAKIGDPIKAFAEAIDSAVASAFAKTWGMAVSSQSASFSVGATERGTFFICTNTITVTLPAAADAGTGFPIMVFNNGTGIVTVDGDASETINGNTTVDIYPGDYALITSSGAAWSGITPTAVTAGTFTPTYSGFSSAPVGDWSYFLRNNTVWVRAGGVGGTSNANNFGVTGVPAAILPTALDQAVPVANLIDNGADGWGSVIISASGYDFAFQDHDTASWTISGNKGFSSASGAQLVFSYRLSMTQ